MKFYRSAVVSSLLALATPAMSAIINNGGFESPSSSPPAAGEWQYNGAGAGRDSVSPFHGSFSMHSNNTAAASNANVQQLTASGTVAPLTTYPFSFNAKGAYGIGGLGQAQIVFMSDAGAIGAPVFINIPASASYAAFSQNVTTLAGTTRVLVSFNAVTGADAGSSSELFVDNVAFGAVPEPTTLAALSLAGVALKRRRKA